MQKSTLIQTTPEEIAQLISAFLKKELQELSLNPKFQKLNLVDKPHLTRQETADFFDVSLNCINNWCNQGILQPFKVGQRTYFKKSDLVQVLFDQ